MLICLVTIVLIKAITHHSKWSQTRIFHCSSSRGFCIKGVHLNEACSVQWKQLLRDFSTSHKRGWGIFLSFCLSANHTITVWTELNTAMDVTTKLTLLLMFLPHAGVLLFWVFWLLCGKTEESVEPRQTEHPGTNNSAVLAPSSGLQFPNWPHLWDHKPSMRPFCCRFYLKY